MKKNLLTIIILALLIVNIVLTAIMMFSVTGAARRTSDIVGDIASILQLELGEAGGETGREAVALQDLTSYAIVDPMTIPLKRGEDGNPHFVVVKVSLSLNSTNEEYADFYTEGSPLNEEAMIKEAIISVFGRYTLDQLQNEPDVMGSIKSEMLDAFYGIYGSDLIYDISFPDYQYQ